MGYRFSVINSVGGRRRPWGRGRGEMCGYISTSEVRRQTDCRLMNGGWRRRDAHRMQYSVVVVVVVVVWRAEMIASRRCVVVPSLKVGNYSAAPIARAELPSRRVPHACSTAAAAAVPKSSSTAHEPRMYKTMANAARYFF